jgi:hypothetical protein
VKELATDGPRRRILVPDDWTDDYEAIGVVEDLDQHQAWEVVIGQALKRGYWEEGSLKVVQQRFDPIPIGAPREPYPIPNPPLTWEERDRLYTEVGLGIGARDSKVRDTPESRKLRQILTKQVAEGIAKGYMPDYPREF